MVVIEKEGFAPESIAVTKSMGGAVAGNIIAGGLIGWGVDAMTGAQYNLAPNTINVRLSPKADQPVSASARWSLAPSRSRASLTGAIVRPASSLVMVRVRSCSMHLICTTSRMSPRAQAR